MLYHGTHLHVHSARLSKLSPVQTSSTLSTPASQSRSSSNNPPSTHQPLRNHHHYLNLNRLSTHPALETAKQTQTTKMSLRHLTRSLPKPTTTMRPTLTTNLTRTFTTTPTRPLARMTVIGRLGTAPEEVPVSPDRDGQPRSLVRYVLGTSTGRGEAKKTSWFRVASFVEGGQKEVLLGQGKG